MSQLRVSSPSSRDREASWKARQLELQHLKDEEKFKKARDTYAYQNKTLAHCETWGGLCLSAAAERHQYVDDIHERTY